MGISIVDRHEVQPGVYVIPMSAEKAAKLKELPMVVHIAINLRNKGDRADYIFPHDSTIHWNEDFFGPLYLPKRGVALRLNTSILPMYRRAIEVYEHNKVEVKRKEIYINGKLSKAYTFKMDYYWMMGDNRHNSADSRFWGFVPEDHVVGKASFIWMSMDAEKSFPANIRWSRLFRFVHHN